MSTAPDGPSDLELDRALLVAINADTAIMAKQVAHLSMYLVATQEQVGVLTEYVCSMVDRATAAEISDRVRRISVEVNEQVDELNAKVRL